MDEQGFTPLSLTHDFAHQISVLESRYNSYHQTDMDCQKQLKSDLYKNADRDYKHKMIELKVGHLSYCRWASVLFPLAALFSFQTLEHTTKDLDKYHKSLELWVD